MSKETTEVRNEFIHLAYNNACGEWKGKIKAELPELFNGQLRPRKGLWVKLTENYSDLKKGEVYRLLYAQGTGACWYVDSTIFKDRITCAAPYVNNMIEATQDEVGAVLKAEAVERGLIEGTQYMDVDPAYPKKDPLTIRGEFTYYDSDDSLTDGYGGYVYKAGEWATAVEIKTLAEAEKLLNCKIVG